MRHGFDDSANLTEPLEVVFPTLVYAFLCNLGLFRDRLFNHDLQLLNDSLSHFNSFSSEFHDCLDLVNADRGVTSAIVLIVDFENPLSSVQVIGDQSCQLCVKFL